MARRKRLSINQIMERNSLRILDEVIPDNWVIHSYGQDFGIDLSIEPFKEIKNGVYETLGEQFFVQLKSANTPRIGQIEVYERSTVEETPLKLKGKKKGESKKIDVIKYSLDYSLLQTIQAMGSASPVLLIFVRLDTKQVYFLCLNDYIDKVILPESPYFHSIGDEKNKFPKSKVIYIPLVNELTTSPESLKPIRFYAKRSKYYNAFLKMQNQYSYLNRDNFWDYNSIDSSVKEQKFIDRIRHFIDIVGYLDIWEDNVLPTDLIGEIEENIENIKSMLSHKKIIFEDFWQAANNTWGKMQNLAMSYEKVCREYWLPLYRN